MIYKDPHRIKGNAVLRNSFSNINHSLNVILIGILLKEYVFH